MLTFEQDGKGSAMTTVSAGKLRSAGGAFRTLYADWELLTVLVPRTWRSRGKGGLFSALWPVVTPLFLLTVYYCAFGVVLNLRQNSGGVNYALSMFSGMALFNVFAECLHAGANSIISRPGYVRNASFDLEVLPLTAVGCAFLTGLCWFAVILAAAGCAGMLGPRLLWLPLVLIPFGFFCTGVALFAGAVSVYLRDFPLFAVLLQQGLFFLTPIVYPAEVIPASYRPWLFANPLTGFVEAFRAALFGLPVERIGLLWVTGIAAGLAGWAFFRQTRKGFIDAV